MFNIGFGEFAIIFIVLIIAVGPERLPTMMRTIGKTMRTLRQASRDLRQSTGIDELMRDDFIDIYSPPKRKPAPPAGPALVGREEPLLASSNPMAAAALAASAASEHAPSLPSDGPVGDASGAPAVDAEAPAYPVEPSHADLEPSLPSDAPVAAAELDPAATGPAGLAHGAPPRSRDS